MNPRRSRRAMVLIALGLSGLLATAFTVAQAPRDAKALYARDNLIAWCIVPFDAKKRGPEDRAAMLEALGFKHFAYDWRAEHIPTFDAEVEALKKHGVKLDAFWVAPGELNRESRLVLDLLKRHGVQAQLWVLLDLGGDKAAGAEQERRIASAAAKLGPLADEASKIGCSLALYNHGGWFGEPENQIAIIERLKAQGIANVGMVYNLHHGHDHLDRFPELLAKMKPYLVALNLNGMVPNGDRVGKKILQLGQGTLDLELLKTIRDGGYRGPIGILGHTDDDAEERLKDNLDGLDWLLPQLEGKPAGPRPTPRTPVPAASAGPSEPEVVARLVEEATSRGDARRGAEVFAAPQFACSSCHKLGGQGGAVGPSLEGVGLCLSPEKIVESVLWPARQVEPGYSATVVATRDGRLIQGYKLRETEGMLELTEATTGLPVKLARADIEASKEQGTLMPEGLAGAMTPDQRRDLIRFLMGQGKPGAVSVDAVPGHAHAPASFAFDREPRRPEHWPNRNLSVNRDRVYEFYEKEADYFSKRADVPPLLPPFPGLDGGKYGHWGNQNDDVWMDGRWNDADLGNVLGGVFRGAGVTVPKGVCVRLGDRGEMAACFNPETLCYEALWEGGFVKLSPRRHGFMDGLPMDGKALPRPAGTKPDKPFVYHGYYRHGKRVIFSYRLGEVEMLDAPWVEAGKFSRQVGPADGHPLAAMTKGGPSRWPDVFAIPGAPGLTHPYAVDTFPPPVANPWRMPLFFGDLDFLGDGTAMLCTMQGDVWAVKGIDASLKGVTWRRFASGLHQALGLVVADDKVYVLGRDQITRLHDLDGDGEADFHENVSNAYKTSEAGHDFLCGLQRDAQGNFYTASGKDGILKISPDGKDVEVLATGFRNPDGLGLSPDGVITVPCSEGEWTPASMICEIRKGGHYGYGGPKDGRTPDLPLVYLPRGVDNSAGAQVSIDDDRWGPVKGLMVHLSHGAGTHFLLLRDRVDGQPQGAVVPLPGDFLSGIHRGRFNPKDGQLYVCGMNGWGTYTAADGSLQRVRYTGEPVQLPVSYRVRENGVLIGFSQALDPPTAGQARSHFAQAWNYRYSAAYGSAELSPRHPGMTGHDPLAIASAHVLPDGRTLFLEIPDLQPVNQLHLHLKVDSGPAHDLFATVNKLGPPFGDFPGHRPSPKTIAAHPLLRDLATASSTVKNPFTRGLPRSRAVTIEAGKNLSFSTATFAVRAGEPIKLTFLNPDVVPHNWALIRPGSLARVGDLVNRIVAEPDAAARHYVPRSDDVIAYTDTVPPGEQFSISFVAPKEKGRYPYLCTFPGHWMVMNGVMIVE